MNATKEQSDPLCFSYPLSSGSAPSLLLHRLPCSSWFLLVVWKSWWWREDNSWAPRPPHTRVGGSTAQSALHGCRCESSRCVFVYVWGVGGGGRLLPPGRASGGGSVRTKSWNRGFFDGEKTGLNQRSRFPAASTGLRSLQCSSFIPIPVSKTTEKCPQSQAADATQPPWWRRHMRGCAGTWPSDSEFTFLSF